MLIKCCFALTVDKDDFDSDCFITGESQTTVNDLQKLVKTEPTTEGETETGEIAFLSPNTVESLIGSLVVLPESLLDANSQLPERCAVKLDGNYSSLIVVGRGGIPTAPGDYLPAYQLSSGDWNKKRKHKTR